MDGRDEVRGARGRNAGNRHPMCPATDPVCGWHARRVMPATPDAALFYLPGSRRQLPSSVWTNAVLALSYSRKPRGGADLRLGKVSAPPLGPGCDTDSGQAPKRVPSWRVLPG